MEKRINNEIRFLHHGFNLAAFRSRPVAELKALSESPSYRMQTSGGIAIIPIRGPINRGEGYYGETDMYDVMRNCDAARTDPSIAGALFVFDSPGGTASGCAAAADSIAALSAVKPTVGYSFMCCSAAYYMASQVRKLYSSADAMNGSIGTTTEMVDMSEYYAKNGVKVTTFDTGDYKNVGHDARPLTEEDKTYVQGLINDLFAGFVKSVASGRKMSQQSVKDLQAKVYIGAKAIDVGLIDGVASMSEVMSSLAKSVSKTMSKTNAMRSRELMLAHAKVSSFK
jgi:capsid assembly protease